MLGLTVRAAESLGKIPASNEGLNAGDDAKVRVTLRVLASLDLEGELLDISERLVGAAVQQGVGLGEELVLDAAASDAARLCAKRIEEGGWMKRELIL